MCSYQWGCVEALAEIWRILGINVVVDFSFIFIEFFLNVAERALGVR